MRVVQIVGECETVGVIIACDMYKLFYLASICEANDTFQFAAVKIFVHNSLSADFNSLSGWIKYK